MVKEQFYSNCSERETKTCPGQRGVCVQDPAGYMPCYPIWHAFICTKPASAHEPSELDNNPVETEEETHPSFQAHVSKAEFPHTGGRGAPGAHPLFLVPGEPGVAKGGAALARGRDAGK